MSHLKHYALKLNPSHMQLAVALHDDPLPEPDPDTYLLVTTGHVLVTSRVITQAELDKFRENGDLALYDLVIE